MDEYTVANLWNSIANELNQWDFLSEKVKNDLLSMDENEFKNIIMELK